MKKRVSIIIALTLVFAMALSVMSGCNGGGSGGAISAWVGSSPETLDPCMNSSADGATYLVHLSQGLFRYKWDGSGVELGDAESYEISDDGLVWTFKLRNDIKWSDGQKVTAQDYEYSWKRVCDPEIAAPYAWDMAEFLKNGIAALEEECSTDDVGVKAIDETTFEVILDGPCPFFDQVAVFPVLYPVRKDIIESKGENWWTVPENYISNGPYTMTSFTLDDSMTFEKNSNYYDKGKIKAGTITWQFCKDDSVALTNFRAGNLDLANGCPPEEIQSLSDEGVLKTRPLLGTYYLSFNNDVAPFNDPLVRKALTLAIDREYIANTVMQGTFMPATAIVGGGFGDVDQAKDFRAMGGDYISLDYEANKTLAKQALADAGYPNGEGFPTIEYMYNPESSTHKTVAEVIENMWREVLGIKTDLVAQEWSVFLVTRRDGNYQVARNGWLSDWNDASSMLGLFTSSSGNNDCNYKNSQFDSYMSEAASTNDRAKRIEAMHKAEDILMGEYGGAPIMLYAQNYIVSKDLKDWHESPLGYTFLHLARK